MANSIIKCAKATEIYVYRTLWALQIWIKWLPHQPFSDASLAESKAQLITFRQSGIQKRILINMVPVGLCVCARMKQSLHTNQANELCVCIRMGKSHFGVYWNVSFEGENEWILSTLLEHTRHQVKHLRIKYFSNFISHHHIHKNQCWKKAATSLCFAVRNNNKCVWKRNRSFVQMVPYR